MRFSSRWLFALGISLFPAMQFLPTAAAQDSFAGHFSPPIFSLRELTRLSGYIFDGTVLSVERGPADANTVETVLVTFRVEQGIRGVRNGEVLTVREWSGLWNSGARYQPGERLLLFFHRPSNLGLTSPVGWPLSRIAVDTNGNAILDGARMAALFAVQFTGRGEHVATSLSQTQPNPASQVKLPAHNRINTRTLALAIQRMARE